MARGTKWTNWGEQVESRASPALDRIRGGNQSPVMSADDQTGDGALGRGQNEGVRGHADEQVPALTPSGLLAELRNADHAASGAQKGFEEAIAAHFRRDAGASAQAAGLDAGADEAERERQKRAVADWARKNGRSITRLPQPFTFNSPKNVGGAEHDVWPDAPSRRWLKVTKPSFGVYPTAKNGSWTLSRTTPAQYLEKLAGIKELFGVETRVHGVLLDVRGNPSFIVSQADIAGEAIDQPAITKHFSASGFTKIDDQSATYYRPADNTMLFDAHPGNVVEKDGQLVGYDVGVIHPTGELRSLAERDHAAALARRPPPHADGSFLDKARLIQRERHGEADEEAPESKT